MRKIIHLDMDAFYASVEQRDYPGYRGKPLVVGGTPSGRGVVASASYEARKFGIHSAMPSRLAKQKCHELIFVPPRFEIYPCISKQIHQIFERYTDLVEPVALDEAYLNVTENKQGLPYATTIARHIRADIFAQTNLTASAGVSFNKFLAKMASGINKPNGLTVILPSDAEAFVEALPIEKFHGIGKVTKKNARPRYLFWCRLEAAIALGVSAARGQGGKLLLQNRNGPRMTAQLNPTASVNQLGRRLRLQKIWAIARLCLLKLKPLLKLLNNV